MERSTSFRDLIAWQQAIKLVKAVYRFTSSFPGDEKFGLTSQMRRAAVSIPSNIAEGQGRATRGEFLQFLGHARGSLSELETQMVIAAELDFVSADAMQDFEQQSQRVRQLLNGLMNSLKVTGTNAGA